MTVDECTRLAATSQMFVFVPRFRCRICGVEAETSEAVKAHETLVDRFKVVLAAEEGRLGLLVDRPLPLVQDPRYPECATDRVLSGRVTRTVIGLRHIGSPYGMGLHAVAAILNAPILSLTNEEGGGLEERTEILSTCVTADRIQLLGFGKDTYHLERRVREWEADEVAARRNPLRRARMDAGLTLGELARAVGLTPKALSRIELDKDPFPEALAVAIATVLEVPLESLGASAGLGPRE